MSIQFEGEYIDEGALRPNPNSSALFQTHAALIKFNNFHSNVWTYSNSKCKLVSFSWLQSHFILFVNSFATTPYKHIHTLYIIYEVSINHILILKGEKKGELGGREHRPQGHVSKFVAKCIVEGLVLWFHLVKFVCVWNCRLFENVSLCCIFHL